MKADIGEGMPQPVVRPPIPTDILCAQVAESLIGKLLARGVQGRTDCIPQAKAQVVPLVLRHGVPRLPGFPEELCVCGGGGCGVGKLRLGLQGLASLITFSFYAYVRHLQKPQDLGAINFASAQQLCGDSKERVGELPGEAGFWYIASILTCRKMVRNSCAGW